LDFFENNSDRSFPIGICHAQNDLRIELSRASFPPKLAAFGRQFKKFMWHV